MSDKKIPVSANGTTIDHFLADIVSSGDYYPFGSPMYGRSLAREECTDNTTVTPVTDLNNTFTGSTESYNTLNSTLSAASNNLLITKGSGNVVFGANRSFTITQSGSNHALSFNMVGLATNGVNVLCKINGNTVATISATGISNISLSTLATGNHTISFETASSVSGSNRTFTIDDVQITYDVTSVTTTCNPLMSIADYKYGFNGMEKDDDIKGLGNSLDFGARIYDSRLGQFLSLDPLTKKYPALSAYVFVNDNPILYKDIDGKDWIYYDESGKELNRTKSKWYHLHWFKGDKKIILTNREIEKGGFFAYVNFHGTADMHSSIVDVSSGDLYEARHPELNGEPVNGRQFKDKGKLFYEGNSTITKFPGNKQYEFANSKWWNYKVKNKDGSYSDKSPDEVGVTFIWIPNRQAMLDYLNSRVGENIDWTPLNNCKTFCRDAFMEGFKGVTDENHLEIKNLLQNDAIHPGTLYNEFEENKSIRNPDK